MTLATRPAFAASVTVPIVPGPTSSLVISHPLGQGRCAAAAIVLGVRSATSPR